MVSCQGQRPTARGRAVLSSHSFQCAVGREWKPSAGFSKRSMKDLEIKVKRGVNITAATTGMICREHSGEIARDLECHGPCHKILPLEAFSKNTRAKGENRCKKCVAYQLEIEEVEEKDCSGAFEDPSAFAYDQASRISRTLTAPNGDSQMGDTASQVTSGHSSISISNWEDDSTPYAPMTSTYAAFTSSVPPHSRVPEDSDDDGICLDTDERSISPPRPPHAFRQGTDTPSYASVVNSSTVGGSSRDLFGFDTDSIHPSDSASCYGQESQLPPHGRSPYASTQTVSTATTYREMQQKHRDAYARQPREIFNTWDQDGTHQEQIRVDGVTSDGVASSVKKTAPKTPPGSPPGTPKLGRRGNNSPTPKRASPIAPVPRYQTTAYRAIQNKGRKGNWAGKAPRMKFDEFQESLYKEDDKETQYDDGDW